MAISISGSINVVSGATHTVDEVYQNNTANINRQGDSIDDYQYEFDNSALRIDSGGRLIVNGVVLMTASTLLKVEIRNGGVLQIGDQQLLNGVVYPSALRPSELRMKGTNLAGFNDQNPDVPVAWRVESAQMLIRSGGRVEIYGGIISYEEGNFWFENGAEFFVREGRFYTYGQFSANSNAPRVLFFSGSPANSVIDIDGLTSYSEAGWVKPLVFDQAPNPGVKNYNPTHCGNAVQFNYGSDGTEIEIFTGGNRIDVLFNTNDALARVEVANIMLRSLNGGIATADTNLTERHAPWILNQFIDWTYNVSDPNGPINAIAYINDTNNGQRGFAFASGNNVNQKHYVTNIPTGGATQRLLTYIQDRGLNTDPNPGLNQGSTAGAPNPPVDKRGPFSGWIRAYGYQELPLSFDPSNNASLAYLLAPNREVSLSLSQANLVQDVTVLVHIPAISWQGLNWGITIQVGGSTTAVAAWHFIQAQISSSEAFADLPSGVYLHNMWPTLERSDSGLYYDDATQTVIRRGVRIINDAGNVPPGVLFLESDDESVYTAPLSVNISFTNLVESSEITIRIPGSSLQIYYVENSQAIENYTYVYPGSDLVVDALINHEGYDYVLLERIVLGVNSQEFRVEQQLSTAWVAPI